jgi:hypothetical protein
MGLKEYSAEDIGLWLVAQGLGDHAPTFVEEGVDGDLLLSLTIDDLKNDLGLSSLQAKKVLKNIEFSKNLTVAAAGGGEDAEQLKEEIKALSGDKDDLAMMVRVLEDALKAKDDEIAELKNKMGAMHVHSEEKAAHAPAPQRAPAPAPKPAPAPAPKSHQPRQPGVVGGAARGAAGGAMKGAIIGAILPGMDASDGAAAGAAAGAASGGLRGLGARRRGRR